MLDCWNLWCWTAVAGHLATRLGRGLVVGPGVGMSRAEAGRAGLSCAGASR